MSFSLYKGGITKTNPVREIDLNELVQMVQDNSNIETFNHLRFLKEIDEEKYKSEKRKLPLSYITPASVLKKRNLKLENEFIKNFVRFSGYMYFDIDNVCEPEKIKESLVKKHPDTFSFIGLSTGGKGLSILIRINLEIKSKEVYKIVWEHLKNSLFSGFTMDERVNDIGRSMFIGFDPNPYLNLDSLVHVDPNLLDQVKTKKEKSHPTNRLNEKKTYSLDDTFFQYIPINEVLEKLVFKTPVSILKPIVDVFPINYVKGSVYFSLKKGVRRKTFIYLIHQLCFLNPDVDPSLIFNYLNFINNRYGNPKWDIKELKELFSYVYQSIKNDSDYIFSSPKLRYIHFRKNIPLTKNEKKHISNKLNGILQKNLSVQKIHDTKEFLKSEGIKITQKNIQKFSGLSITTIKRYYRVEDLEDIQWWIDFFNSEEYMESMGYQPISSFNDDVNSFENQMYFHPTCPQYVIDYYRNKKSA